MKSKKEQILDHQNFHHLHAFLDRELSVSDIKIIEEHVSTCKRCFGYLEELSVLSAALENLEEIPMESNLSQRVFTEIKSNSRGNQIIAIGLGFQLVTATIGLILMVPIVFGVPISDDAIDLFKFLIEFMQDSFNRQFFRIANLFPQVLSLYSESKNFLFNIQIFNSHDYVVWPIFSSSVVLFMAGNFFLFKNIDGNITTVELSE
jgi:hypothetical protein